MDSRLFSRPSSNNDIPHLSSTSASATEAIAAVEIIGPRVYRLNNPHDAEGKIRFYVLGCHGNGKEAQKAVAELMNETASRPEQAPAFILFTGDNLYDYGTMNPEDPAFNKCHHDIYGNPALTAINQLPCFMLLGNHDENFHAKRLLAYGGGTQGKAVGVNEVAHTYLKDPNQLVQTFQEETLNLAKLPHWVMPYFFYSIIIGDTQIFCLNSNRYLEDYYAHHTNGQSHHPVNQAVWLKQEYETARAAGRQVFLALHHPLSTDGKRAHPSHFDSTHYSTNDLVRKINALLGTRTYSHNALLAEALIKDRIEPDLVLCAHDHVNRYAHKPYFLGTKPLRQFTSGGGGGDLQHRVSLKDYPSVACHLKQNGFGMITTDAKNPQGFTLDLYTLGDYNKELTQAVAANQPLQLPKLHLRFNHENSTPIQQPSPDEAVNQCQVNLRECCERYLSYLKRIEQPIHENYDESIYTTIFNSPFTLYKKTRPKPPHEHNMIIVHDVLGTIDQFQPLTATELVVRIEKLIGELSVYELKDQELYNDLEKIIEKLRVAMCSKRRASA